ncbi:hypothetical protein CO046_05265 [Candidatus Peregrinibacteria bacterium CG_4_9_14_0_2_um_filter_53_11]|nr:MAG: hypothetical protein CO046_05265 [Candidatus Peregrinibacteria bacterium CG_4_9_14_0_2_um_filter_53_11]
MFTKKKKPVCASCARGFQWLTGLTLLALGSVGVLEQLGLLSLSPWGWILSVLALMWGLLLLLNVGCKKCAA